MGRMGVRSVLLSSLLLLYACERPRVPLAAPINSPLPSKMSLSIWGKQNLGDIPEKIGTISASKGHANIFFLRPRFEESSYCSTGRAVSRFNKVVRLSGTAHAEVLDL